MTTIKIGLSDQLATELSVRAAAGGFSLEERFQKIATDAPALDIKAVGAIDWSQCAVVARI